MSSLVHTVLSTELTCIPNTMHSILGRNFNNSLCNGVTWLFVIWTILYFCYDKLINASLKQLGFIQYLRTRLSNSLWLLAVFVSFFTYFLISRSEYDLLNIVNFRRTIVAQFENVQPQKALAHAIVCSFYLHMAFTQGLQLGSLHSFLKFIALLVVYTSAYTLRFLDIPFTLTALVAITGIFEGLSKIVYSLLKNGNKFSKFSINVLYISSVIIFCVVYLAIIPLSFLIPLGTKVFSENTSVLLITLFATLLFWLNLVIYKSILLNLIFHWLYHLKRDTRSEGDEDEDEYEDEKTAVKFGCLGQIIGCSLFPPRTDASFMMAYLRSETKRRQRRLLAKRKPKNRNMIVQTLKCMMALKRKLNEKKAGTQNADDSGEKAEQDNLIDDEEVEGNEDHETAKETTNEMKKSQNILRFADDVAVQNTPQELHDDDKRDASETEIGSVDVEENQEVESSEVESITTTESQCSANLKLVQPQTQQAQTIPDVKVEKEQHSSVDIEDGVGVVPINSSNLTNECDEIVTEDGKKNDKPNLPRPVDEDGKVECASKALVKQDKLGDDSVGSGNGKTHHKAD